MTPGLRLETLADLDAAVDLIYASWPWTARSVTDEEIVAIIMDAYELSATLVTEVAAIVVASRVAERHCDYAPAGRLQ
ncbi:MAG: hypothetical protein M3295_03150 [Chloroflexota bacterium]|nr:hypothetical protein [Chloroflexota bacterium]